MFRHSRLIQTALCGTVFAIIFCLIPTDLPKAADPATPAIHSEPGGEYLKLTLRSRHESEPGSGIWQVVQRPERWDPERTAVLVTDMWDRHWCESASERVAEIAPSMNRVLNGLRERGALIIHAPSGTMDAYEGHPARDRAIDAPYHSAPEGIDINTWNFPDPDVEPDLPIDDSDEGCDKPCANGETCVPHEAWSGQIDTIEIRDSDAISDSGQEV